MATKSLILNACVNEDGDAQNPSGTGKGVWAMLKNPDGTVHTNWATMTQDTDAGTGAYKYTFTINDASDVSGTYMFLFKAVTDAGKTPIGCYPVTVIV